MKISLLPAAATALTLALPAQALDLEQMSDIERATFHAEIRAYLLENPEVIMEAVAVLEAREAAMKTQEDIALVQTNQDALFADGFSWQGGNPDGDITLVEFMDYRCGYCRRAFDEVHELIESDGNIRFIVKELPILGEESTLSARFAIAAHQLAGNDAYKAAHDALISFSGKVNDTSLRRMADTLELDADAIIAHMDSQDVTEVISANHALAGAMQISGTPSFVMGDQMIRGYVPLDGMQQIAQEIRDDG